MKKNVGLVDKAIRIIVALVMISLVASGKFVGGLAILGCVIAAIFIFTSFVGLCPLYSIFGISTQCRTCVASDDEDKANEDVKSDVAADQKSDSKKS